MDTATAPAIETSPQANLEVISPVTSTDSGADMDWASRLDSAMDQINKETGATKHGKIDDSDKTRAQKQADKTKAVVEKAEKKISPEAKSTEDSSEETPLEETKDTEAPTGEETPKGLTEKASVKWGELRNENRTYKKEIETLKAEVEKLKATPTVDNSEVEKLKQINSEYEKELAVARVEATQEYKSNVVEPMVNVVGFLNTLATKYELSSKDMLNAFSETDPTKQSDLIADIAASMNERDRLKFYSSADDYSEIIKLRDSYQSSSQERMAKLESEKQAEITRQQQESEKLVTEARAAYEKATTKVFEDLKKQVPVLSDAEVAADVQRLAKGDYSNANPELKSYLAHSGAILPHILKALQSAKADLDKANKTIAGYRNGSPKAGSGSTDSSRSVPEDVGFLEALDQQLG